MCSIKSWEIWSIFTIREEKRGGSEGRAWGREIGSKDNEQSH